MHDLDEILQLVVTLLLGGSALVAGLRVRPLLPALLAAIGLGLLALPGLVWFGVRQDIVEPSSELLGFMGFLRFLGAASLFVAFLVVPARQDVPLPPHPEFEPHLPPDPLPAFAPPTLRPGWGLPVAWIILSALSWIAGGISIAIVIDAGSRVSRSEEEAILISALVGFAFTIPATIVWCVWLYRAWTAVPESCRSATPGQAVGFLFIPFFNLYWCFRAIPGLSASIRRGLVAYEGPEARGAGQGLGVAACIVGLIPYVGILAWPLFLAWTCLANSAKNRLLNLALAQAR
jgi:hypothetical protein